MNQPSSISDKEPLSVELTEVWKRFPGVVANAGVELAVQRGSIHALLGENGAGKSTLMNILAGVYRPDSGELRIHGRSHQFRNPADALSAGVGMVHQEFRLIPSFSVAENIVLGSAPPVIKTGQLESDVAEMAHKFGLEVDPAQPLWQLSMGERQKVEILKVLWRDAQVLILDEPTTVLTPSEVDELGQILRRMANDGRSIIFISHKLHEISGICDQATVLRQGKTVANSLPMATTSQDELARLMVGASPAIPNRQKTTTPGQALLELKNLSAQSDRGVNAFSEINFQIHSGEIVGIAGVAGNGQRELADTIAGLRPSNSGTIIMNGTDITTESPHRRFQSGLAYIPEDRLGVGLAPQLSITDNAILRVYRQQRRGPFILGERALSYCKDLITRFGVRAGNLSGPIAALSGGNLQRLLVGRELDGQPSVVVASQPTRGLDVNGVKAIQDLLIEQRDSGAAVMMISEDLDELLAISDRLLVIEGGVLRGEFDPRTASRQEVGMAMLSDTKVSSKP
ncbi:MAG: heme ABC transporter ATP-binding protein [Acidimicrobiaceae bacterium]|nr:heme ABC transporter ATP-binding protein [Acidimicrobiaceae bacterium]|tara:strand:- start:68366 stop:69907 length:1542 start_codon:yes stop_codon:yes gene_type:complete